MHVVDDERSTPTDLGTDYRCHPIIFKLHISINSEMIRDWTPMILVHGVKGQGQISIKPFKQDTNYSYMTFWDITISSDTLNWSDITPICELITELDLFTDFDLITKGEITHCIESVSKVSQLWGKLDFL